MLKRKLSEISNAKINNVILFSKDNEDGDLKLIKKVFKVKDCGVTSQCLNATKNIFNCDCYSKCKTIESNLKDFL